MPVPLACALYHILLIPASNRTEGADASIITCPNGLDMEGTTAAIMSLYLTTATLERSKDSGMRLAMYEVFRKHYISRRKVVCDRTDQNTFVNKYHHLPSMPPYST